MCTGNFCGGKREENFPLQHFLRLLNAAHFCHLVWNHLITQSTGNPGSVIVPQYGSSALEHVVCLGESRLSQVDNSARPNVFPAWVANFGKAMYRSLERSTQDIRDGFFCTVPRPHFLGRALIWPGCFGEHILGLSVWVISFEFVKVCGIRFSIWESFIGFYICCYPISTILACLFSALEFESRGKSCVECEHAGENGISCLLPCILLLYIE